MPTYDYKCPTCETIKEEFHLISEDPVFMCDHKGTKFEKEKPSKMKRIISGGAGWGFGIIEHKLKGVKKR